MMEAVCTDWSVEYEDMQTARLTMKIPSRKLAQMPKAGAALSVSIKQYRRRRSLDANSYMWFICEAIAREIQGTREDVYRQAVKAVGHYEILYMRPDAAARFVQEWRAKGLGYMAEPQEYLYQGQTPVTVYFGSHSYTTEEMARLINWLRDEAEGLGLDVETPNMKSLAEMGA